MELSDDQQDGILRAIRNEVDRLRADMRKTSDPMVDGLMLARIDDLQEVIDALESGEVFLYLELS